MHRAEGVLGSPGVQGRGDVRATPVMALCQYQEAMSPKTTWIVQTNVEPESTSPTLLRTACSVEGRPFHPITVVPRSPTLPELPDLEGPVVLHGRTTLILRALEHPRWRRGVFFDPERFQHRAYVEGFGDRMLNARARVVSWDRFLAEPRSPDDLIFLKPNDDLKHFTGGVLRFSEHAEIFRALSTGPVALSGSAEVVVATPVEVDAEWRLFIVEGRVVTGSMYRPSADSYLPPELVAFAEDAAAGWAPAQVFVLDVGRAEGAWKIVECNCFNGSRFYSADVERLVRMVSELQERSSGEG